MTDLDELYEEQIKDHGRRPRNFRIVEDANRRAQGYNPFCGDQFTVYLKMNGDVIEDVGFQGNGCSISQASASMMTQSLKGKTRAEAEALFRRFHSLVTGSPDGAPDAGELGKLAVFAGVCKFPVRVKCASLPWHTLRAALEGSEEPVSTE